MNMKKIALLFGLLLTVVMAHAQTERRIYTSSELKAMQARTEEKKETKEQKKLREALQDSINYAQALHALETLNFVMEADQLVFKRGRTAFVTSQTNFVSLSDDKAIVQIAPFNGGGPNGVGGITLEGRASNIRIKTDKKGNTTFMMSVMGTGLSASIDIRLNKGSNKVSVTVNPNFHSNRVTLNGRLLPSEWSNIHQGRAF